MEVAETGAGQDVVKTSSSSSESSTEVSFGHNSIDFKLNEIICIRMYYIVTLASLKRFRSF